MPAYTCPWHPDSGEQDGYCERCLYRLENAPKAADMTPEERAAEVQDFVDKKLLTVPFEKFHERMEEVVGRPVFTHEFARPENLIAEIRGAEPKVFDALLNVGNERQKEGQ